MKLIKNYLESNKILNLKGDEQLIALVELVAKIPYGEGRNIKEVLQTKKFGTCTGKHLVLQACLDELSIKYKNVVCTFHWGDQRIIYPKKLLEILNKGEWKHGHNFMQIEKSNGLKLDADITWNEYLKPHGFRAFPKNWGGKTSFIGIDKIIKRWDGADVLKMKKKLIEDLSPELRKRREHFLREFFKWTHALEINK